MAIGRIGRPVTIGRIPSFISTEQLTAAGGVMSGMLFSDLMAALVVGRYALTGGTALAVSAFIKGLLGVGGFVVAGQLDGLAKTFAWLVSVASFGSIGIDLIRTYVWTGADVAAARLKASFMGMRPGVIAIAPPVRVRAETPSGQALGGF